jgi:hypothetical protein
MPTVRPVGLFERRLKFLQSTTRVVAWLQPQSLDYHDSHDADPAALPPRDLRPFRFLENTLTTPFLFREAGFK